MEQLSSKIQGEVLTLEFHKRIDSTNADAITAEVDKIVAETPHASTIVDADDLVYISSAGLRILLKLRKADPSLRIINVSSEVYEILEMTGFTEMITVEKGYRKLSVEGCEVIGKGANGAVYRLDPETIIKVYLNPDSLPDIQKERALARRAFVLGVPTAIPYDVVRVGEGYGSVFELLNSDPLAKLIKNDLGNWEKYAEYSIELLKKIHATEVDAEEIPNMKEVAVGWASFLQPYLPEDSFVKLMTLFNDVPESNTMLHGDYHVKNVMLQNGEPLLIDMDTLCHGNPVFEFGSIYNAYLGFSAMDHDQAERFLGIPREITEQIWYKTLREYFGTEDQAEIDLITDKASLVGYVRLMRRSIRRDGLAKEPEVIEFYKNEIIDRINRLDKLTF